MSGPKRLFGTDGIRGQANTYPMTGEVMLELGRALALVFRLRTNNSIETWLLDDDPRRVSYEKFVETFGTEEFVLLVYSDPELFSTESFRENHRLSEKLPRLESSPLQGGRSVERIASVCC